MEISENGGKVVLSVYDRVQAGSSATPRDLSSFCPSMPLYKCARDHLYRQGYGISLVPSIQLLTTCPNPFLTILIHLSVCSSSNNGTRSYHPPATPILQVPIMNRRHIVVFSGGSAANNLVDVFGKVAEDKQCSLS